MSHDYEDRMVSPLKKVQQAQQESIRSGLGIHAEALADLEELRKKASHGGFYTVPFPISKLSDLSSKGHKEIASFIHLLSALGYSTSYDPNTVVYPNGKNSPPEFNGNTVLTLSWVPK